MTEHAEHAISVDGSYGVGKTSVLEHVGDLLEARDRPFSLMDVDRFHRSWPVAPDDEEDEVVEARDIAAVWADYRSAGPRQLVLSGVLASARDVTRYQDALRMPIRSVRLVASPATVEERLRRRYDASRAQHLGWHLRRHAELTARQAHADLDEAVIETDRRSPAEVARLLLERLGMLAGPPRPDRGG